MKIRSWNELKRKAKMALNVFQTSILGAGEEVYLKKTATERGYANNLANPGSVRE